MKESELLRKAAAIIERNGLCRNRWAYEDGRVCSMGAIYNAAGASIQDLANETFRMLDLVAGGTTMSAEVFLRRAVGDGGIPRFNDNLNNSQEDVLMKFKEAIVMAEAEEELE